MRSNNFLLLNDTKRNLLTFTESFDNTSIYPRSGLLSVTANNATSPNNSLTADTVVEDAAPTTQHRFIRVSSLNVGLTYTLSCFVKHGVGSRQFQIGITGGGLLAQAYFNLTSGVVGTLGQCTGIITIEGNGWFRCSLTCTTLVSGNHNIFFAMTSSSAGNSETYSGDGASSLIIWGAQLEVGQLTRYQPVLTA